MIKIYVECREAGMNRTLNFDVAPREEEIVHFLNGARGEALYRVRSAQHEVRGNDVRFVVVLDLVADNL